MSVSLHTVAVLEFLAGVKLFGSIIAVSAAEGPRRPGHCVYCAARIIAQLNFE